MARKTASRTSKGGLELSTMRPFLEGLLTNMEGGVFTIDRQKRITSFSKSAMWTTGYCLDDVIGKECSDILKSTACETACPFISILKKGGSTHRSDKEIIGKDGKAIPVHITAFALKNTSGEIVGMAEIFRDISEIKSLKNQLMQSDRFAVLGQVAASVAHEINNPLNGILTYVKLIAKKLETECDSTRQFDKYLSIIERETINMARIVKNLLDFSRHAEAEIVPLDVKDVIEQSLLLLRDALKIGNIEVKRDSESYIPQIMGDFGQLQQVFANIMLNSIHAMPRGGTLTVETMAEGTRGQECFVRVAVSDTGSGIPEENLPRIFDPLFTTKGGKDGVGLGLGLSIVQRIVKEHRGKINVKSTVGKGTTFRLRFPAK
jgi:PAS domain S-box-containing protein